jgi:hypothetical protein
MTFWSLKDERQNAEYPDRKYRQRPEGVLTV